jgi:hypothetical protein
LEGYGALIQRGEKERRGISVLKGSVPYSIFLQKSGSRFDAS